MKLSLSIKIFTIFLILQQITCAVPEGMVLAKNLTDLTSLGVYSLGNYPNGGSVTVTNLRYNNYPVNVYQKDYSGGVYTG